MFKEPSSFLVYSESKMIQWGAQGWTGQAFLLDSDYITCLGPPQP